MSRYMRSLGRAAPAPRHTQASDMRHQPLRRTALADGWLAVLVSSRRPRRPSSRGGGVGWASSPPSRRTSRRLRRACRHPSAREPATPLQGVLAKAASTRTTWVRCARRDHRASCSCCVVARSVGRTAWHGFGRDPGTVCRLAGRRRQRRAPRCAGDVFTTAVVDPLFGTVRFTPGRGYWVTATNRAGRAAWISPSSCRAPSVTLKRSVSLSSTTVG